MRTRRGPVLGCSSQNPPGRKALKELAYFRPFTGGRAAWGEAGQKCGEVCGRRLRAACVSGRENVWVRAWCVQGECVRPPPCPSPGLHLDLIWSGCDSRPAGPTRNEKLPSCEAPSSGRCAARPLGRWQRRGPGGPGAGPTRPGAQKWWIDQIDEAGLVLDHWLSRRFWSEPGPRARPPVALRLTCQRSAAGPGRWRTEVEWAVASPAGAGAERIWRPCSPLQFCSRLPFFL